MYIPNKTLQCVTLVTRAEAVFFTGDSLCVCLRFRSNRGRQPFSPLVYLKFSLFFVLQSRDMFVTASK
jgi:hypothetical protein